MNSADDFFGPVNIGNPGEFTILQLARMIIDLTGSSSKIDFQPLPADDPTQRKPDITLAENKLGWQPKISLEQGLAHNHSIFSRYVKNIIKRRRTNQEK